MLLRIETYHQNVVNHKTARACFEQFANAAHPARSFWLDGASSMGKSYLLDWFERNIENCHIISFNLIDNASMQFVLLQLTDEIRGAGFATAHFDAAAKPKYSPSRAEISNITIEGSPQSSVSMNVEHAQNSDEMLVLYTEQVRALASDIDLMLQSHQLPRFIIIFDQMDRYDHATCSFIYRILAPTLYAFSCFQILFSGHHVIEKLPTVPDRRLREESLKVTLAPFTKAEDIAEYLRQNGGARIAERDLDQLSEEILSECHGMPNLVGKFVKILCGGESK